MNRKDVAESKCKILKFWMGENSALAIEIDYGKGFVKLETIKGMNKQQFKENIYFNPNLKIKQL